MAAIIVSVNDITGDIRLRNGSLVVDSGVDKGLEDDTGNYAGSFTAGGNAAVGYLGTLGLWADGQKIIDLNGGLNFGLKFNAAGERAFKTIKQAIHSSGIITFSAGTPSLSGGAHNVNSITDLGVGHVQINHPSNGSTSAAAVGSVKLNKSAGVVRADSGVGTATSFSITDLAYAQQDWDFLFIIGSGI